MAPVVEVVEVQQKDVPIYKEWVGTTDGLVNASIRAQVQGYLIKQDYHEGDFVRKGQVLFEIDPRTYQAALDQAKSDLAQQEARWTTAKANLARIKPLAAQNAVSQKDLDDATGAEASTAAAVGAAQAAVETAQLNLNFTTITSPIDGIAGIANAQLGNLVGPGLSQDLTTVSTVNPIKVYINVSEQEYLKVRASMPRQSVAAIPLELILSDGSIYPYKGHLVLADRQVDPTTGTLKVGSLFPNPGNLLRVGQFGKVRAQMEIKKGALLVPQRAVAEVQGYNMVAVVGPDNKVSIKPVKPSNKIGGLFVIDEGLKPGEKVIAEGIQKVKEGLEVTPKPYVPEAAEKTVATSAETASGTSGTRR